MRAKDKAIREVKKVAENFEITLHEHTMKLESHEQRIHELEQDRAALNKMATSIAVMAEKQNSLINKVDAMNAKVDVLEQKPVKRWDNLITAIISSIVGIVIGWILTRG